MPNTVVKHEALIGLLNPETVHTDPALSALRDQWWDLCNKEESTRQLFLRIMGGKETIEMAMLTMTGHIVMPKETVEGDKVEEHPMNGS